MFFQLKKAIICRLHAGPRLSALTQLCVQEIWGEGGLKKHPVVPNFL